MSEFVAVLCMVGAYLFGFVSGAVLLVLRTPISVNVHHNVNKPPNTRKGGEE